MVASGIVLTVSGAASSVDVHGVGEGRVLDAGRGPQRALRPGATRCQRFPARRRRPAARTARRQAVRWRAPPCRAARAPRECRSCRACSSTSVSTRLTKNDATDAMLADVPARCGLKAGHVRVDDLAVALEREDQRDVDADPFGQALGDRGQPLERGRDLDEQVRPVHHPPQGARLGDGLVRLRGPAAGRPRSIRGRRRRGSRRKPAGARHRPTGCRRW